VSNAPQGNLGAAIAVGVANYARQIAGSPAGRIVTFDRATQTAEIEMVVAPGGTPQANQVNVPVLFPPYMAADLQPGTPGHMITAGLNWKLWWRTGEVGRPPEDSASHSLACASFLPDLRAEGDPRDISTDATHLLRPVAGGTVRLGTYNATKAAVHEDLMGDFTTFLLALDNWGSNPWANWAAAAAAWTLNVQPALNTLGQGLVLGKYISPSVKVED
jgi:hypothetical protein